MFNKKTAGNPAAFPCETKTLILIFIFPCETKTLILIFISKTVFHFKADDKVLGFINFSLGNLVFYSSQTFIS